MINNAHTEISQDFPRCDIDSYQNAQILPKIGHLTATPIGNPSLVPNMSSLSKIALSRNSDTMGTFFGNVDILL